MHQPDEKHCNEKTFAKDEKAKKFDYSPALQVTSFHSCEGSFKHVNDCGKIPWTNIKLWGVTFCHKSPFQNHFLQTVRDIFQTHFPWSAKSKQILLKKVTVGTFFANMINLVDFCSTPKKLSWKPFWQVASVSLTLCVLQAKLTLCVLQYYCRQSCLGVFPAIDWLDRLSAPVNICVCLIICIVFVFVLYLYLHLYLHLCCICIGLLLFAGPIRSLHNCTCICIAVHDGIFCN